MYIPLYRTTRKGVIRDVPLDLSEEEILGGLESVVEVSSVQRLGRRGRGPLSSSFSAQSNVNNNNVNSNTLTPSRTILITFRGQTLPDCIYLYMLRYPVIPYVSKTSLCFKCFRFGHIGAQCKSHARCIDCGDIRHGDNETCPKKDCTPVCINCNRPDRASEYSCPEYSLQRRIREFAAYENVPLSEAATCVRDRLPAFGGDRPQQYDKEYPLLPGSSPPNREGLVLPSSRPSRPYSGVLSSAPAGGE